MRASVAALIALAVGCGPTVRPAALDTPKPAAHASSTMGWRCPPGAKACLDRAAIAPGFRCEQARCVQPHPTMPDDGEWTCGETAGVTLCTGGETAAGVAPAPLAPGWVCGIRHGGESRGEPAGSAGRAPSREGLARPREARGRQGGWRVPSARLTLPGFPSRCPPEGPRRRSRASPGGARAREGLETLPGFPFHRPAGG